jgi:hypothetical protein
MMNRRSFVVRVWLDEDGVMRGQISDPLTDWRRPFQEPAQLWAFMKSFLVAMPAAESLATYHDDLENSRSSDKTDSTST